MGKYDWKNMKDKLQKGVGEKQVNDYNDPREWKLQRNDQGIGTAVIRLLPGKGGDTASVVRIFEHSFKSFNKKTNKYRWYIEQSPSSIKEDCPMVEIYYELGEIGTDEAKKIQDNFSRRTTFISNILVVNDPSNPENNGKIFYWKYGKSLFEKFQQALEPTEDQIKVGKKPIELFDPEDGADIILDAKIKDKFVNYDNTSIAAKSKAFENEEQMDEAVLERCYDLTEFISVDNYKTYTELKDKIAWVIEKSPIESFLLSIGSAVITEPYEKNSKTSGSTTKVGTDTDDVDYGATPIMGGSHKPKVTEDKKPAKGTVETNDNEVEPVQTIVEKPKESVKREVVSSSTDDDDILALLNDL